MLKYLENVVFSGFSTANDQLETTYINYLARKYNIFKKLKEKMEHSRHKQIGYPLDRYQMFALLLYCNGDCNYDLSRSQRCSKNDNNFVCKKWPVFDAFLNSAIQVLNGYETHEENIYTGLCNVYYEYER